MISAADWAILLVSLLWGSTFVVIKEALGGVSPLLFLALRFTVAAAALGLILRRRLRPADGQGPLSDWRGGAVSSLLLFLGYALQTTGLELTTASRSAFLTALYIVLVPLLAPLVHQNRPRAAEVAGVALAAVGTALLTGGGSAWSLGALVPGLGDALTLGCALAFAGHILAVAHYSRSMGYERLAVYQICGVAVLSWLTTGLLETPRLVWSAGTALAIVSTALLATALAFLVYTWAQRRVSATRAALIFASEPVFAGLLAWRWAGEAWTPVNLAGAGLILSGIVLVEVKPGVLESHQED